MKYFTFSLVLISSILSAQDFESYELPIDTFLNGSDGSGEFLESAISFPNSYDPMWDSWSGWSISTMTDTETRGFTNQYASISGGGAEGTDHYATSFILGETTINASDFQGYVSGFYINNSTYAYYSMLEGDAFAKKFGGVDGTDPDYFYVSIKDDNNPSDSIIFFLADFRPDDPAEDYIINEWTWIETNLTGNISMTLYSSDVGSFGINTPTYLCIDEMQLVPVLSNEDIDDSSVSVFPNPSAGQFHIDSEEQISSYKVYDLNGKTMKSGSFAPEIDLSSLAPSIYILELSKVNGGKQTIKVIKN